MDSRDDGVTGTELLAGLGLDAPAPSTLEDQPAHWPVGQDRPTVGLDDAAQCSRQAPGATLGDGPAVALAAGYERVGERARARTLRRLQCSLREPYHPRLDVPVLENIVNDIPRRDRLATHPDRSLGVCGQLLINRREPPGGRLTSPI